MPRGFAAMDPELQAQIASKGGRSAHRKGVAHQFTSDEAVAAGRLSGLKHTVEHMSQIGRNGGLASAEARRRRKAQREAEAE